MTTCTWREWRDSSESGKDAQIGESEDQVEAHFDDFQALCGPPRRRKKLRFHCNTEFTLIAEMSDKGST